MNAPLIVPPHSIESEQSVIGALLLDNRAWFKIADVLDESDFYRDDHRRIFGHIQRQIEAGKACDLLTLSVAIENSNEVEQTGGVGYLAEIANATPSAANIKRYAEAVREASLRRKLLTAGDEIAASAHGRAPVYEAVEQAQSALSHLADYGKGRTEPRKLSEVMGLAIGQIEEAFERGGRLQGLATGFEDLDSRLGGLRAGDYVVIAGRPSMGKTTLGMNIAENVGMDGKTAMVFSLEMGDVQLGTRTLSRLAQVELDKLRSGRLDEGDFDRIGAALGRVQETNLIIDETPALSVSQMHARARRQKQRGGLDLILIDYLGLITAPKGQTIGNRNDEVTAISAGLKRMAKDLGVPVICLAQLSRKVEERSDKHPMMSDLRDSGSIEQDADIIILMYRDDYYRPDSPEKGFAEANVAKHRNGEPGIVPLVFQGRFSRFCDAHPEAINQLMEARSHAKPVKRTRNGMD
jgi:replicative DNA helicase